MNKQNPVKFTRQDVEIISQTTAFKGFYQIDKYTVRHQLFAGGWSKPFARELFCRRNAAGVLLYDPVRQQVILIEQFRIGALDDSTPWMLEVVAGLVDEGETTADVVKREAQEEAGVEILALMPITRYWSSPGGSSEQVTLFCGKVDVTNAGGIFGLAAEDEDIRVHLFDVADAYAAVASGLICNSLTIIALQWLQLHEATVRTQWIN